MEDSPSPPTPSSPPTGGDLLARLAPSGITFLFVAGLLVAARFYDRWPFQPAPCGMRTLTGFPCVSCGGTRAMRALAIGDFPAALSFNPLAVLAVLAALLWFGITLWQTFTGVPPRSGKRFSNRRILWLCLIITIANWIYLILFLPE